MFGKETAEPLYEYIKRHLKDGVLPEDFSLPKKEDDSKIRFADGAMDGMSLYHMGRPKLAEEDYQKIEELLELISAGNIEQADAALLAFSEKHCAIAVIDEFENYIINNIQKWNTANIYHYAVRQIQNGSDRECVKYGMEILELFSVKEESLKDAVRIMGLSDEFTFYVIYLMLQWENANEEIFYLAQKVTGWGRIHAIEKLEPETEEIKDWLLKEGIKNQVMPEYSALTCFIKADVRARLRENLTKEEFQSIGHILEALIAGGPVEGISALEDGREILKKYLEKAEEQILELSDYETVRSILQYAGNQDNTGEELSVSELCQKILTAPQCREIVEAAIREGNGIELAIIMGIDYKEALLHCLNKDFHNHYFKIGYLMSDETCVEKVIDLFERELPLDKMQTGPQDEIGLGPAFSDYQKLDFCIQNLNSWPLKGVRLIKAALNSPVVRNRNLALRVIQSWTETEKTTLKELSEDLYAELQKVLSLEVREDLKENMKKII